MSAGAQMTACRSEKYQTVLGFGGAFTDAAALNSAALSDAAGERLVSSYYSPTGSQYNIGRINIGTHSEIT